MDRGKAIEGRKTMDERAEAVLRKYEDELMGLPNVQAVGIGEKAGKPVIKVFVVKKLPESSLQPDQIIATILEGFEVVVEEIGTITPAAPGAAEQKEETS